MQQPEDENSPNDEQQQRTNKRSKRKRNRKKYSSNSAETKKLLNQLDNFNAGIKNAFLKRITQLEKENANLRANLEMDETRQNLEGLQIKSKAEFVEGHQTKWEKDYLQKENRKLREMLSKLVLQPDLLATKELTDYGKFA